MCRRLRKPVRVGCLEGSVAGQRRRHQWRVSSGRTHAASRGRTGIRHLWCRACRRAEWAWWSTLYNRPRRSATAHRPLTPTMSFFTRDECLKRLRAQVAAGKPIIGGGAGTGISAKCAEAGGIDLIIIYNSGRFRMAGRGSLSGMMPYGDANQIVMDMAREVLPVARNTPVLAGVCGTDPFRIMELFLREVQTAGFSGVQNFPTVGLIDGTMRQGLGIGR